MQALGVFSMFENLISLQVYQMGERLGKVGSLFNTAD